MSETQQTPATNGHAATRPALLQSDESPSLGALAAALAKAQGAMKPAAKDSVNPHFKSSYADLASVWEACRAALSSNGLAVTQRVTSASGGVAVTTMLLHSSGEWMRDRCVFPVQQNTAQGLGSAITYARRYSLAAMVGVAPDEDDDGNAASAGREAPDRQVAPPTNGTRTEQLKAKLAAKASPPPADSEPPPPGDDDAPHDATTPAAMEPPKPAKRPAPSNSPVPKFGRGKGIPLCDQDDEQLVWYLAKAHDSVAENDAKWHKKNVQWLADVQAEVDRRS